jgi:transcriptional antiterminator NusG
MTDAVENTPVRLEVLPPVPGCRIPDLRWYVVHAYSGMEKAVERNIMERINRAGMQLKVWSHSGSHGRSG